VQTRDGYLWLGTGYGLARFDGIHFKTFDETDAPGFEQRKILGLFEDGRGICGSALRRKGYWYDKEGRSQTSRRQGRAGGKFMTICEDSSGRFGFPSIGRVSRLSEGTWISEWMTAMAVAETLA